MDIKQLEYFARVAELGSFTRASIALDIAQPALSRQVRLLEVELRQNPFPRPGQNLHALPDDYRLPLDNLDVLLVTGKLDISLDAVQYNQHTMYHFSDSLAVGCIHCHNSRYFPDWGQPAKYYALTMLQMSQHILNNYQDTMNGQEPSCYLCHRNQVRPPGAAQAEVFLPEVLRSSYSPEE